MNYLSKTFKVEILSYGKVYGFRFHNVDCFTRWEKEAKDWKSYGTQRGFLEFTMRNQNKFGISQITIEK